MAPEDEIKAEIDRLANKAHELSEETDTLLKRLVKTLQESSRVWWKQYNRRKKDR